MTTVKRYTWIGRYCERCDKLGFGKCYCRKYQPLAFVKNEYSKEFDFEATIDLMDNEIRQTLNAELAPCSPQIFFDEYAKAHYAKFGQEWELTKPNPVW